MVLDHRIPRRQLLKSGAAGAAAAAARGDSRTHRRPRRREGKADPEGQGRARSPSPSVTFRPGSASPRARRWAWRRRWASWAGQLPGGSRPTSVRSFRCRAAGGSCSSSSPTSASSRSSSPGTARTPPTRAGSAPNPAPGGVTTPESRAAYLAYGRTLRGFLDEFGLEAIGNHGFIPNTWPGPSSPGGAMSTQRLRALPDRARVRLDPWDALHGHRQRPDQRQRPATSSRGRWPARSGRPSTS